MALSLRQTATKGVSSHWETARAYFSDRTVSNNLIVAFGTVIHGEHVDPQITGPDDFELIRKRQSNELTLCTWYYEGAPSMSSVSMRAERGRSMILKAFEISGAAQGNALDEVTIKSGYLYNRYPETGRTGNTSQADEFIIAAIANRYKSTRQSGFTGGLYYLSNDDAHWYDPDDWTVRLTTHARISNQIDDWELEGRLSSSRDWVAILCTFRGGTSGPARLTSTGQSALTTGGSGNLTVFGPLRSTQAPAALTVSHGHARVGPFNYQYRVQGFEGLLIGSGTQFHVEGTEGLYGWEVRTSDEDLPRGDGASRGIDLASARQVLFKMNVGRGREEVERNMITLYNALVPQRDEDWELIWRHPEQPLKLLRCRPINLLRDRNAQQLLFSHQTFVLRAADPRHYAAIPKVVDIPVSPDEGTPNYVTVHNEGNAPAYPQIMIKGPSSGPAVTAVELSNFNGLYKFDVRLVIEPGATLIGDMEALVTGLPRSIITLDEQSKYGSWQLPREAFRLEPDPVLPGGENVLYLRTDPPEAPIECRLTYRDTWSG